MKRLLAVLMALCLLAGFAAAEQNVPTVVFDYVFDLGTYTELDYAFAEEYFAAQHDNWGGACTAAAKVLEDGTVLVGRNMDLTISNKAAYILRTAVPGCYETLNLMYTYRDYAPDYLDVLAYGLPEDFAKAVPFMADDVLNEKGLYIEVNMRNGESWEDGTSKFSCSGTNPASDQRVFVFILPRYLGEHCADVAEALEYVNTLNLYTEDGYWNYCFMLADASGRYGVLEIAQNRVIWHEGQQAHTNFYIDADLYAQEVYPTGLGRYDNVMAGIDQVTNAQEMFELMDSVSYYQFYTPAECQYDWRSELVAEDPSWTIDYMLDEENREYLTAAFTAYCEPLEGLTRQTLRDLCLLWESAFTEVVDCTNRTIMVRFYEDDSLIMNLGF